MHILEMHICTHSLNEVVYKNNYVVKEKIAIKISKLCNMELKCTNNNIIPFETLCLIQGVSKVMLQHTSQLFLSEI